VAAAAAAAAAAAVDDSTPDRALQPNLEDLVRKSEGRQSKKAQDEVERALGLRGEQPQIERQPLVRWEKAAVESLLAAE
jgi:hypothetical protein